MIIKDYGDEIDDDCLILITITSNITSFDMTSTDFSSNLNFITHSTVLKILQVDTLVDDISCATRIFI